MAFNKKTIEDIDVKGKKVLVRCDFNVPPDALLVSARNVSDRKRILAAIRKKLIHQMKPYRCRIPAGEGGLLQEAKRHSIILQQQFEAESQTYVTDGYVFPETPTGSKLITEIFSDHEENE